jgi:hypothetical protein
MKTRKCAHSGSVLLKKMAVINISPLALGDDGVGGSGPRTDWIQSPQQQSCSYQ